MSFQPPVAKGMVSLFDDILKDMYKLSLISHMDNIQEETPVEYKEALQMYHKITENSGEDDCFKMSKLLKKIPVKEEYDAKFDEGTAINDFYDNFRKFRDLVEQKITLPLQEWKDMKWDLMHFSETYEELQQELNALRNSVEKERLFRNRETPEQEAKRELKKKMESDSERFKSLQPFFIKANAEEHMVRISALKERKLEDLKDQLNSAEQNLQKIIKANQKEIQNIIEESMETKSFIEWIEEKNYDFLKEMEVKIEEEWSGFSNEMEISRNLGNMYAAKHAAYLDIKRQEDEEERLGKQDAAATLLQAHWRGFMKRRRLRGDCVLF